MKKHLYIFLFLSTLMFSCEKEQFSEENFQTQAVTGKTVNFQGIQAVLPLGYPEGLLEDNSFEDFKKLPLNATSALKDSHTSNIKAKGQGDLASISSADFYKIYRKISKRYPSPHRRDVTEIEKAKKFFPHLNKQEILANWETIIDYTEKLLSYDMMLQVSGAGAMSEPIDWEEPYDPGADDGGSGGSGGSGYDPYQEFNNEARILKLTPAQIAYLYLNNRMVSGVYEASEKATAMELEVMRATRRSSKGRGDAIRHSIWNVYIGKYACSSYGTIEKAAEKIKGFTDAHEAGTPEGTDKEMDLHNNAVGIEYYKSIAQRVERWCVLGVCDNDVKVYQSDLDIAHNMLQRQMIFTTSITTIRSTPLTTLVRILDID